MYLPFVPMQENHSVIEGIEQCKNLEEIYDLYLLGRETQAGRT